ncbi:MAG: DUF4062 domain-containing protein [Candidatus Limnocylindria bacterium]
MTEIRSVFISSVISGHEAERELARRAVESMRMTPVMSETLGAAAASPRQALLDEVRDADAYLLLLFPRYGEADESGTSPTEQEFSRAAELAKPIVALVQEGDLEPRQREFLERVRGQWGEGHLTGSFSGASDLSEAVVRGFTNLRRSLEAGGDDLPAAQARAVELARGEERGGSISSSCQARVAFVPATGNTLLDALTLEDAELGRVLADAARHTDLAPHSIGLETATSRSGIRLSGAHPQQFATVELALLANGAVTVEGPVGGTGTFGSMRIEPERVHQLLLGAGAFAQRAWERVDTDGDVRRVGIAIAVLEANGKVFGEAPEGNSLTTGGAMSLPPVVVAPEGGLGVSRADVASAAVTERLLAELRAIFRDAGAILS